MNKPKPTKKRKMSYAAYDYSMWPLVVVTINDIDPTPRQFEEHLQEFNKLLGRQACFRILFDLTNARAISFDYLHKQVTCLKEREENIARYLLCSSIVVTSTMLRGILQMLLSIRKLTRPNKIFKTKSEAMQWITTMVPAPVMTDGDAGIGGTGEDVVGDDSQTADTDKPVKFFFEE